MNVRPYNNKEQMLFPPTVGDYLSPSDLAHVVDEAVEILNLESYISKIPNIGNPSYHPKLMIKIWFYGYATKTYSSRNIEDKLYKDIAFIYLAGMQKPDFKTISEFRRLHLKELKGSFIDIVKICHRLGLTSLGEISVDSKVMKANASRDKSYTSEELIKEQKEIEHAINKYLTTAKRTDDEEDRHYGADKRACELPEDLKDKQALQSTIKKALEQLKLEQDKLAVCHKTELNLTDADAHLHKSKEGFIPSYRAQVAVDSKEQVIVANDVPRKDDDCSNLIPMVDNVRQTIKELKESSEQTKNVSDKEPKTNISADSGYSSGFNLAQLEDRTDVEAYIPDRTLQAKERGKTDFESNQFHQSKFTYNDKDNTYTCPAGKILHFTGKEMKRAALVSVYRCSSCCSCPNVGQCTTDARGRSIKVSPYRPLIIKMRDKLATDAGKQIYSKRMHTAEPAIGNLSHNLGFRTFLLRGLAKVNAEFSLMCTAHNLLKIAKCTRRLGVSLNYALNMKIITV